MSLARAVATAWRQNLLFSVLIELTYRCNLDCFFCYNDLPRRARRSPATTTSACSRTCASWRC